MMGGGGGEPFANHHSCRGEQGGKIDSLSNGDYLEYLLFQASQIQIISRISSANQGCN